MRWRSHTWAGCAGTRSLLRPSHRPQHAKAAHAEQQAAGLTLFLNATQMTALFNLLVFTPSPPSTSHCQCRDMGTPLPECDAVYFPYAVVEIKLQSAPPAWVQGLLQTGEEGSSTVVLAEYYQACMPRQRPGRSNACEQSAERHSLLAPAASSAGMLLPVPRPYACTCTPSQCTAPLTLHHFTHSTCSAGMLLPVPKFSKFLHGTALLFQPRCANVPYWFLPGGCAAATAMLCPSPWEGRMRCVCCRCTVLDMGRRAP